jgi:hypothetical protein
MDLSGESTGKREVRRHAATRVLVVIFSRVGTRGAAKTARPHNFCCLPPPPMQNS